MLSNKELEEKRIKEQAEIDALFKDKIPLSFSQFPTSAIQRIIFPPFISLFILIACIFFHINTLITIIVSSIFLIVLLNNSIKLYFTFKERRFEEYKAIIVDVKESVISKIFVPFRKKEITFKSVSNDWSKTITTTLPSKFKEGQLYMLYLTKDIYNELIFLTPLSLK